MLDVINRTFTTKAGVCLHLKAVSPVAIQRLDLQFEDKYPQAPIVTVEIGGRAVEQPNYDDPEYARLIAVWKKRKEAALASFMFGMGVADTPPPTFLEDYKGVFPDADSNALRAMWVSSVVTAEDEIGALIDAITGQTVPTEAGVQSAAATFQRQD